jgi:hypothetical protein
VREEFFDIGMLSVSKKARPDAKRCPARGRHE